MSALAEALVAAQMLPTYVVMYGFAVFAVICAVRLWPR